MRIVSFDVGIKNLAYCIMENSTKNDNNKLYKIIKWDVINLCGQEMNCNCLILDKVKKSKKPTKNIIIIKKESVEKICNKKAMYSKDLNYYCKAHVKTQSDYIIPTTKLCNKRFKTTRQFYQFRRNA